jgi:hypothetical protein
MTTRDEHKRRIFVSSVGIKPAIPAMAAADLRLRPRGHRDRLSGNVALWAATFGHSANEEKGNSVEGDGLDRVCPLNSRAKRMYRVLQHETLRFVTQCGLCGSFSCLWRNLISILLKYINANHWICFMWSLLVCTLCRPVFEFPVSWKHKRPRFIL